jgi:catechol 2,3-dioxygenase-like lactoylglutathione lyase family enzyme
MPVGLEPIMTISTCHENTKTLKGQHGGFRSFVLFSLIPAAGVLASAQTTPLATPGFHHLHLLSTNPAAAIAFYTKTFPSTSKVTWGGMPALKSPNNVLLLFTKVDQPAATLPQTAMWHFGWHVLNERTALARMRDDGVTLLPLYTDDEGGTVAISSDTFPGTGGVLGLTKSQLAEARKNNVKPTGVAGFAYIRGPDDSLIEVQGDMPGERFNHVHMYQEDPFCAQLWYQKHFGAPASPPRPGAPPEPPRTDSSCKVARGPDRTWPALEIEGTYRTPSAGVTFGDVAMNWYMRQGDKPLVSSRGHLMDHVGLSVGNLDAWITKLRGEGVKIADAPHPLGDTRAVMFEGPSREGIELVEVK